MTDGRKKKIEDAVNDIDIGLNGLLGTLGDAIGEMINKLDQGGTGSVERDQVFESDKGPIRAHAGVRLRMGGLDVAGARQSTPKPVNPDREPVRAAHEKPDRSMCYDLLDDGESWVVSADLPGVSEEELTLSAEGGVIRIETTGTRRYRAEIDLEMPVDLELVTKKLRNGILTLRIPKGAS